VHEAVRRGRRSPGPTGRQRCAGGWDRLAGNIPSVVAWALCGPSHALCHFHYMSRNLAQHGVWHQTEPVPVYAASDI